MTDYSELVKALRRCDMKQGCFNANYRYSVGKYFCDMNKVHKDAAAAIEELQAKLPKRGEWIRVQDVDIPGEIHPVAFKCMCSMCRNEYLFPKIPRYCPECGSMNTAKTDVQG